MRERPILFSGEMVRAILEGRKTQTRRIVKRPSGGLSTIAKFCLKGVAYPDLYAWVDGHPNDIETWGVVGEPMRCPYGQPGDRLWVRETFIAGYDLDDHRDLVMADDDGEEIPEKVWYRADDNHGFLWMNKHDELSESIPWKPSIHMPRWASRITLEITDIRAERLHDISEEYARAEGVTWHEGPLRAGHTNHVSAFKSLWNSINGMKLGGSWEVNPWVWVVEFKRITNGSKDATD